MRVSRARGVCNILAAGHCGAEFIERSSGVGTTSDFAECWVGASCTPVIFISDNSIVKYF